MVQLDQTYYVGSKSAGPGDSWDFTRGDMVSALLLFLSWIGLFIRYGLSFQAIACVVLFTLLMLAATFERKTEKLPKLLIIALGVWWLVSLWFMPYGIGPLNTAAGAGGLVPVFAGFFGMGAVATMFDCLLGAVLSAVVSFGAMFVACTFFGREFRVSIIVFVAMTGLFLGTVGSLMTLAIAGALWVVISLVRPLVARLNRDPLAASIYMDASPIADGSHKMALALTLAVMVVFVFL